MRSAPEARARTHQFFAPSPGHPLTIRPLLFHSYNCCGGYYWDSGAGNFKCYGGCIPAGAQAAENRVDQTPDWMVGINNCCNQAGGRLDWVTGYAFKQWVCN